MMRTFLITGATGFIGGELARQLLNRGDRVVALCRDGDPPSGCEVIRGDIEDLQACERAVVEAYPEGVFHLAAQALVEKAGRDPYHTLKTNVLGTTNMLEAFRRHRFVGARMVVASSDKAYGELPVGRDSYDEGTPLEGRGPYDVSKSCTDLIARSYQLSYSLPIAIIRAGNVYGPEDRDLSRIVPSLCNDVLDGQPLTIRSDGTPVREYLHVHDAAKGYIAAFEKRGSGPFNLGTGQPMSVLELAEEFVWTLREIVNRERTSNAWPYGRDFASDIEHYVKHQAKIEVLGVRKGEIQRQVLDAAQAKEVLGWEAKMSLRDGLLETLLAAWRRRQR